MSFQEYVSRFGHGEPRRIDVTIMDEVVPVLPQRDQYDLAQRGQFIALCGFIDEKVVP